MSHHTGNQDTETWASAASARTEPRGSVLAVATGHMSISPGLVLDEIPLLLALL